MCVGVRRPMLSSWAVRQVAEPVAPVEPAAGLTSTCSSRDQKCVWEPIRQFCGYGQRSQPQASSSKLPGLVTSVGGGYNGRLARTFAQRQQSQQRQRHQQSQQQSSHTLKVRGTKCMVGSSNVNVVVVGSAAISHQLAARSSVQPSCSLRGCDNASLARTIVLGSQAIF